MKKDRHSCTGHRTGAFILAMLLPLLVLSGCFGKYPTQVVELNVTVGKDIEALHRSYTALIDTHFDTLRARVNDFIKNRWTPTFIEDFKKRGNFDKLMKSGGTDRVNMWTNVVMETVESKRKELLAPIDAKQKELLQVVDRSFSLLGKANREITAHLKSRGKGADVLETVRDLYGLKPLREKIGDGLAEASELAKKQTSESKFKRKGESKQ